MAEKIERLTNQKKAILDYLRSTTGHPDAYEVYEVVRDRLPQISLATVYRNLDSMAGKGLIRAHHFKHDRVQYDGVEEKHHHFICTMCERIYNVPDNILLNFQTIKEDGVVDLIEDYSVVLKGVCVNCRRREQNNADIEQ
ncbi:MAG: transcriptional repressor [Patescibacteria group bacterium]